MYIYQADVWCDADGEAIREDLAKAGDAPEDPDDETSYDSDNFPKGPYSPEESDSPDHCAARDDCLGDLITLPSGWKVGELLSDDLTEDGYQYVAESTWEGGPSLELLQEVWWPAFSDGASDPLWNMTAEALEAGEEIPSQVRDLFEQDIAEWEEEHGSQEEE